MSSLPPWPDGEKIPDEHVPHIFQPPPGTPARFTRSTLIVGSRGAGKTTLFRYQKSQHSGIAPHLSLLAEFSCIVDQTGLGPLSIGIDQDMESKISGKASSLLAVAIARRLARHNVLPDPDLLQNCLPEHLQVTGIPLDHHGLSQLNREVALHPLDAFIGISDLQPLPEFVAALAGKALNHVGPLLLLLDRAEYVNTACLVPVVDLMNQSQGFTVLAVTRPALVGNALLQRSKVIVPGDHYDLHHLGLDPWNLEWTEFVSASIRAQLGDSLDSIDPEVLAFAYTISRDSVRQALEIASALLTLKVQQPDRTDHERLRIIAATFKEAHLNRSHRALLSYHPDFRGLVNSLRGHAVNQYGEIAGPVSVAINRSQPTTLFQSSHRLSEFIDMSFRGGSLCLGAGEGWSPGSVPSGFEVPPLLVWQPGDQFWYSGEAILHSINMSESAIMSGSAARHQRPPTVFVAYRMQNDVSRKFRRDIEATLRAYPGFRDVLVHDGHTPAGTPDWANAIRDRISGSHAVVADVTGMRPDVLFELGFARGLKKAVIPATESTGHRSNLAAWLSASQIGQFGTPAGLRELVSSIVAHMAHPDVNRPPKVPQALPGLAVWLRPLPWNQTALHQFTAACERHGLVSEIFDPALEYANLLRSGMSAGFLVICLDGTEHDALMHFIAGAVIAKRRSGSGRSKRLERKIIILEEPGASRTTRFTADSLARVQRNSQIVRLDEFPDHINAYGQTYSRWANG